MEDDTTTKYNCTTCKKHFATAEYLTTHKRMFTGDKTHENEEKDGLVDWLEKYHRKGQPFAQKEDFFEVKDWIENIDPNDPEYRKISTTFMQYGIGMDLLKDNTVFNRDHINELVTEHNPKLDELYISKIWEKILILQQVTMTKHTDLFCQNTLS